MSNRIPISDEVLMHQVAEALRGQQEQDAAIVRAIHLVIGMKAEAALATTKVSPEDTFVAGGGGWLRFKKWLAELQHLRR